MWLVTVTSGIAFAGTPVRTAGDATFSGVPSSVVAGIRQNPPKDANLKPEQFSFDVRPGAMLRSELARGFLNRIVTPYSSPIVKSISPIKVQTAGSNIFISLDPGQQEPVVLYVMDKGDEIDAVSLMLYPKDVGPVEIDLRRPGVAGNTAQGVRFDDSKASSWEQSAPFTETLTNLMRTLAQHKVPPGYDFRTYSANDAMPRCQQQDLRVTPKQVLAGHDMVAFVGELTNTSSMPVEFQEQTCGERGVLAVASWPGPLLQPHQSSEVYVIVRRASLVDGSAVRPSALTGGDSL
ncbi:TraK domain-containing protein [Rhodanobacter sp. FW106-PBR-R2A-1-13]|uniref:TraK domain-containing protein n=1 Tax=Rhodanobacter sp. FW106-PBR-R2A-1-13 TaxID=3454845 RepID=UPI0034E59DAD